jgi:Uncharacterized protein conserved in bacteria (DUF2064)
MSARCVLLFARSPELEGKAKGLYAERAVFELARRRVARAAAEVGATLVVSGGGAVPEGTTRVPQRGTTFGDRLEDAVAGARSLGFTEVVVVPSDVPALASGHLFDAFTALDEGRTPLGPSPDGGVYLIGVHANDPASFGGVRWRTRSVLEDLVALSASRGREARLLPLLRDLDAHRDLALLAKDRLDPALTGLVRDLLARDAARPARARVPAPCFRSGSRSSRAPPPALAA